jgi:signal peptidase I
MEPTLLRGDCIVAWKWGANSRAWQRHDVVTYHPPVSPDRLYIGRIIGLPGETVEIRDDQVLINGDPLTEQHPVWVDPEFPDVQQPHGPERVPDDAVFLLGDNRNRSQDSRHFGPVSRSALHGSVEVIYFSRVDEEPPAQRMNALPVRKPGPIRWQRFGRHVQ